MLLSVTGGLLSLSLIQSPVFRLCGFAAFVMWGATTALRFVRPIRVAAEGATWPTRFGRKLTDLDVQVVCRPFGFLKFRGEILCPAGFARLRFGAYSTACSSGTKLQALVSEFHLAQARMSESTDR